MADAGVFYINDRITLTATKVEDVDHFTEPDEANANTILNGYFRDFPLSNTTITNTPMVTSVTDPQGTPTVVEATPSNNATSFADDVMHAELRQVKFMLSFWKFWKDAGETQLVASVPYNPNIFVSNNPIS
jgi:hypothetical protein